jgi:hypothetical protein
MRRRGFSPVHSDSAAVRTGEYEFSTDTCTERTPHDLLSKSWFGARRAKRIKHEDTEFLISPCLRVSPVLIAFWEWPQIT